MAKKIKVFSKKLFMEDNTQEEYLNSKSWVDYCDGKKLNKEDKNGNGTIKSETDKQYLIVKEWVEEIEEVEQ